MHELAGFVRMLAERAEVDAVVLASRDGLPIEQACPSGVDADALAALAATAARDIVRLSDAAGRGGVHTALVDAEQGLLIVAAAGDEGWLVVLTRAGANVGELLFELRRRRSALAALL